MRLNGRIFEAAAARPERRDRCALIVRSGLNVEMARLPSGEPAPGWDADAFVGHCEETAGLEA